MMADSLLDFLQTPDAQLGLALMAASGPTARPTGVGERIFGALQSVQGQHDAAMKRQLLKSQIDENTSQNKLREGQLARQARQDAYFLGDPSAASAAPAASGGAAQTSGGAPALPGSTLKAAIGAPAGTPNPSEGKFDEWSRNFGIPKDALVADYFTNGGKGIADMLMKRGTPDMQVTNGYAYDKNRVQPGFLPALNTSQDGKSTMTLVDPATGLPRVMATPGAVDAFSAFQNAAGHAQANWTPETVYAPNGQKVMVPRSAALAGAATPQQGPGYSSPGLAGGSTAAAASDQVFVLTSELSKAQAELQAAQQRGDAVGAARAQGDVHGLTRELQRLPGGAAAVRGGATPAAPAPLVASGNVVELSPTQQTANEAARVRAIDTAKADVGRDSARQAAQKMQGQIGAAADLAAQLLGKNPTGSGAGALADTALNFIGQPTKSGDAAQQLEALSGWMVANVPRMEGPQSNADVLNYQTMAGRIGDRSLPVSTRKAALETVKQLQAKYADLNAGVEAAVPATPAPSATNSVAPKGQIFDTLPPANASNRGRTIRDTATGQLLISNGLQWKPKE